MQKCDVIIPVYNSPEWVKMCVYSVFINTEKDNLNKVILIDDCSNEYTKTCLKNLSEKYGSKLEIMTNQENLGFVKTCNKGLEKTKSDYVLLLNTDCIITKNTISKLMNHMQQNKKIGLICPVASNAANITLEMFEGFTFSGMNKLLEKKFNGMNFDACTVVGNCLMISRECINNVGYLDEIYGMGYGEETDYQFKSLAKGFEAKVAIDTYVFHKSEVSFGVSKEKKRRLERNRNIFFSRWENEYNNLLEIYKLNDPIEYIKANLTSQDTKVFIETGIYLPDIVQNAGGVHMVVDMVNYMAINDASVNILYNNITNYKEIMLFNPISVKKIDNISLKKIVSTIYASAYLAKEISIKKQIPLINFVQGYEAYFEIGYVYGIVELTYKLADYNLTISNYLQKELENNFNAKSFIIQNGINADLIKCPSNKKHQKTITIVLRGSPMKGDWILLDILKKINNDLNNIIVNIIYNNEYIEFPSLTNETIQINKYLGPLPRTKVYEILQGSDIFVDASLSEGFGLTPLEAMVAGNAVVVSNSHGINEYIQDDENGYIINEVNNPNKYMEKIKKLVCEEKELNRIRSKAQEATNHFDIETNVEKYIKYFDNIKKRTTKDIIYTPREKVIINAQKKRNLLEHNTRNTVIKVSKLVPKSIKKRIKKLITILYGTYQH